MNETASLLLAGFAGFFLGAIFFGGLWWTVQKAVVSPRPGLWFLGSLILRTGIVVAGFYFVGQGRWERLLLLMVGFLIARSVVLRWTRPQDEMGQASAPEAGHAT